MRARLLSSIFCIAFLFGWRKALEVEGSEQENKLQADLFKNYRKVRPVKDFREPITISFRLGLFRILVLDERSQTLNTLAAVVERWNDTHLQWNPEEYGGIRQTVILYDSAWVPDIILYNSASEAYSRGLLTTNLVVQHTGEVMLEIWANFLSTCNVDAEAYPFDRQTCSLLFMSWTQERDKILMTVPENRDTELVAYRESAEFKLESYTVSYLNYSDPCCVIPFSAVEYIITISRKAMFYLVINFVLPMVVVNVIALLAFLVPCESGEKVTLGISTMLNMIIFLTSIRDLLPPTEQIPLIGKFYCVCICLVGLEVGLSIFTLYLHHLEGVPLPQRMQDLCRILSKLPFMTQPKFIEVENGEDMKEGKEKKTEMEVRNAWAERSSMPHFFDDMVLHIPKKPLQSASNTLHVRQRQNMILSHSDEEEKREWKKAVLMAREHPDFLANLENWRIASKILDRFFLYVFTALNIAITIGIMFYSPNERIG